MHRQEHLPYNFVAEGRIVVAGTRPNSATADPAVAASQLAFTSVSAAIMIVREIAPEHQWAFPVRIMRGKGVTAKRSMHISVCKLKISSPVASSEANILSVAYSEAFLTLKRYKLLNSGKENVYKKKVKEADVVHSFSEIAEYKNVTLNDCINHCIYASHLETDQYFNAGHMALACPYHLD
uniref:Uncharacterized protein n=1 Tax=Oryza barthii TaxID=65489 RepID=A0A0D3GEP6_9ORYZ